MSYADHNPGPKGTPTLLILGGVVLGVYLYYKKKEEEEAAAAAAEEAFHALEERVEMEDFNPLTALTKVGGLMGGELKVISLKRLTKAGSVEDDMGQAHKYKARQAWLVGAQIDGGDVLLLVRRNGSVELLEG